MEPVLRLVEVLENGQPFRLSVTQTVWGSNTNGSGEADLHQIQVSDQGQVHEIMALVKASRYGRDGKPEFDESKPMVLRVESFCYCMLFPDMRHDCHPQFEEAKRRINEARQGVLLLVMDHQSRGMDIRGGLARTHVEGHHGTDSVKAERLIMRRLLKTGRLIPLSTGSSEGEKKWLKIALIDNRRWRYATAALIFLGVPKGIPIRLLTDNPSKDHNLRENGFWNVKTVALVPSSMPQAAREDVAARRQTSVYGIRPLRRSRTRQGS
jgi:GTP cyclohydrolase II